MFWILGLILLLTLFYYYGIKPLTYWRERGVKQDDLLAAVINNYFSLFKRQTLTEFINGLYKKFPGHRYHGWYQLGTRGLMITDLDLLKQMVIKDFEHFNEHRAFVDEKVDPLWAKNLFALRGTQWRNMRSTLSPSFTSSKMKGMFVLMTDTAEKFINYFLNQDKDFIEIEIKEVCSKYCTDVIASTAFGLEVDSLANPNNEFFKKGKEFLDLRNLKAMIRFAIVFFFPKISQVFDVKLVSPEIQDFFTKIIVDTIKLREEKGLVRPDMIHLLLEARKGNLKAEEHVSDTGFATAEEHLKEAGNVNISNDDIVAQALIFFFAGFDSSSTLISFMAYELCANQDVQDKLRDEIEETLANCNNKLTYEGLVGMKYMDMVVSESLRKWPVQIAVERVCSKPYTIPPVLPDEKPLYLETGSIIGLLTFGIHHDPNLFPDPEVFDPERFSEENKGKIKSCAFQPFGLGPRNCIGSRFALLETKMLFFYILKHFKLVPTEKSDIPIQLPKHLFSILPDKGINMGFKRIQA